MRTPGKSASLSVVTLSWPIFIEIFLQMLVGNIDQFMMSHYSQPAVAAVANANQIMNIFIMLITVMSTASTILIAQYLGARRPEKINEVCTVSVAFMKPPCGIHGISRTASARQLEESSCGKHGLIRCRNCEHGKHH